MSSIFSKIISKELPCFKLAENEQFLAFLDIRPISKGHALVIPKKEIDYFFDLDNQDLKEIMCFAKPIAKAIQQVVPCKRVGVMVAGLEVPHAHVHLVPMMQVTDLNFANAKQANVTELESLAKAITAKIVN